MSVRQLLIRSPGVDVSDSEICFSTALDLVRRIREGELSARQVMEAHLSQIERLNPELNAIVTLHPDRALEGARAADEHQARGEALGPLHGLPIAHKDLVTTRGIRTTFGSRVFRDYVPTEDALIVERLVAAGAVTIGKTNTPEFGAGSQTYNEVFGETLNPYDTSKTCGGSSGGAATALAAGMLPIADGSDMGGSLRNPGNFCNVVGLRPSPGRVPTYPTQIAWSDLAVLGPMARTVGDAALMLSAIAGPDPRCPISIAEPGAGFAAPLERDFRGVRIAWSRDLGELPVDSRVTAVIDAQRPVFESLGCVIEDGEPDFSDADPIFKVLRAWTFSLAFREAGDEILEQLKETVAWNIEQGRGLSADQVGEAQIHRTRLYHRVRRFMEDREFLILPVNQVPPFDLEQRYVTEIAGEKMETYIDWMKSCYYVTVTGHPAISVPCGFTPEGLPVGVQIVGRHRDDFGVLQLARAFEEATGFWRQRPSLADDR